VRVIYIPSFGRGHHSSLLGRFVIVAQSIFRLTYLLTYICVKTTVFTEIY